MGNGVKISSFSVILIMIVLMIVGGAMLPLLNIQYSPSSRNDYLTVSYTYTGASARVVEAEVTSKIEGVLNSLNSVVSVSALSQKGEGSVTLEFKKGTKMDAARFEVATLIRQIYDKLPEGVSYPVFNMSTSGGNEEVILSFTLNADLPPDRIVSYAEENLVTPLSRIDGVESVRTSGATPFQWVITFDPDALRAAGLTTNDLSLAFSNFFSDNIVGTAVVDDEMITVRLLNGGGNELGDIPVKNVDGRIFFMRDFATITYEEALPTSYFRINGLNTINLSIYATEGINSIKVSEQVKETLDELKRFFPENFSINLTYDVSEVLSAEINKIFLRSILSLVILLLFVLVVSRSFRYLFVIFLTIVVNLLTAVIFYYIGNVDIQLYSMAGITISLGIIIDTAIVMVDHYSYYHNRNVVTSIIGALLTTIAALMIVFFLPDQQKQNLVDFVWVIIINLSLSMLIALAFVPALLDKMPLSGHGVANPKFRFRRRVVRYSNFYKRFILWGRRHRWAFIVVLVLGFGIPIHLLPTEIERENLKVETGLAGLYNRTIGGSWYQDNKKIFERTLGGTFRLFATGLNSSSYYRAAEPQIVLTAEAYMPEGCTVQQLNEIMMRMENWLSQFEEIDMYRTTINSSASGNIRVTFKKEFENSIFPFQLKQQMWNKAVSYGGATWSLRGIDIMTLSNNIYGGYKQYAIRLYGYNYDMLYRYAERLIDSMSLNRRVSAPEITKNPSSDRVSRNEFYIDYDRSKIANTGLDVASYYSFLGEQLFDRTIGSVFDGEEVSRVKLISGQKDEFDRWHITNDMIDIDSVKTRLSDVGTIEKRRTGNDIVRNNQEYEIRVAFDFIGPYQLADSVIYKQVDEFNNNVLPIGYRCESTRGYWTPEEKRQQAILILLVVVIIYMICAVIFESLSKPFVVIMMIPVGFIGMFLTYSLGEITFDQGGFAAMVMVCGIVVNAGVYIIGEFNTVRQRGQISDLTAYIKAYNRKIIPTLLTIISTVLGLSPFLFDGKDDVFWYAFATGTMGGMAFSIVSLVLFMPVFMPLKMD